MSKLPQRGDIFWVNLNPTLGSEINKIRPAVIISNNVGNEFSQRVIIAPITSKATKIFPFEVKINLGNINGKILLDQIRSIDKIRLNKKVTSCDSAILEEIDSALKLVLSLK